jgi:hypothetical protein
MLARCSEDGVVKAAARKILADEMQHLEFQREFLRLRLRGLPRWKLRLWRWQFRFIHRVTALVVTWDHRRCLRVHGTGQAEFRRRAAAAWSRFVKRLGESPADGAGAGIRPCQERRTGRGTAG